MNAAEQSAGSKAVFAAKVIAALLSLPAGAALLGYEVAGGRLDAAWFLLSHLFLSLLTIVAAILLRLFVRGWWTRLRLYFFLAWMTTAPAVILSGMLLNALLHWGGPPD